MQTPVPLPVHQPLSKQIVGIDGLRLAAACLVMAAHLGLSAWLPSRNGGQVLTHAFDGMRRYVCYGWVGVQIFFVISGFVIAYSAPGVSAGTFARHRFLRLYPMAFLCATLVLLAVEWGLGGWSQSMIFTAYLHTIFFVPSNDLIDDPFWTLTVEAVFYCLVYLLLRTGNLRHLTAVMSVLGAVSAGFWLLTSIDSSWSGTLHDYVHRVLNQISPRNVTLIPYGCYFALGVLLWDCLLRRADWKRLAAIAMCLAGGTLEIRHHSATTSEYLMVSFPWWGGVLLWYATVAVIVLSTIGNSRLQAALGPRGVKLFRTMGLLTYPLYLLHNRIGTLIALWFARWTGYPVALALAVLAVFTLAYVMAMKVDPHVQRILKPWLPVKRQAVAV